MKWNLMTTILYFILHMNLMMINVSDEEIKVIVNRHTSAIVNFESSHFCNW